MSIVTKVEYYDFGPVERGTVSSDKYIGTTNELSSAVTLTKLELSGIHSAHYTLVPDMTRSLPYIFSPGDSYVFIAVFSPEMNAPLGQKSARVRLYSGSEIWLQADLTGTTTASGIVPHIYDIITEESILPSGTVFDDQGNYVDSYDIFGNKIVDKTHGVVPAGSSIVHEPPRLKARGNIDLREFRQLIRRVLGIVSPDLIFVPAYPKSIIGNVNIDSFHSDSYSQDTPIEEFKDTITWKIVRREVGVFSGPPFSGSTSRKEIRPRIRERSNFHPSKDNQYIDIYGQWFDNLVQFDVWSKTNEEAEVLIEWFEDFMDMYRFLFTQYGLETLIYWRRFEDESVQKWANPFHVRSVQYFCRTEKLTVVPTYKIKEIHIKLMETVDTVGEAVQYGKGEMQRSLFSY